MANLSSIARPYALAAFEYARDKKELPKWKAFLESACAIATQRDVVKAMANPELPRDQLGEFFQALVAIEFPTITAECRHFLSLLSHYRRFNVLPEIAELFNSYYAALEKNITVKVITAVTAQDAFKKKLGEVLTKRASREVALECEVDPAIIGGAVVHIGDSVIDGSIRGKLTRLFESLTD